MKILPKDRALVSCRIMLINAVLMLVFLLDVTLSAQLPASRRSYKTSRSIMTSRAMTEESCSSLERNIRRPNGTVQLPLSSVAALWTSSQCEVRPGPQYILRKYRFYQGGLFELRQFIYSDSHCHRPAYTLSARGRITPYQRSWIIDGAHEIDYEMWHVSITPYSIDVAVELERKINGSFCLRAAGVTSSSWRPYERREVFRHADVDAPLPANQSDSDVKYNAGDVIDCLDELSVTFHELQLMRCERRRQRPRRVYSGSVNFNNVTYDVTGHHSDDFITTLLLGDIHTEEDQRSTYRPMSYQEPLVLAETPGCKVCSVLVKSTDSFPPLLPSRPNPPAAQVRALLHGYWTSERCETRPYGTFLTRSMHFLDGAERQGRGPGSEEEKGRNYLYYAAENIFSDALCRRATYSVHIRGIYRLGSTSSDETQNIDLNVTQINITCRDKRLLEKLNKLCPTSSSISTSAPTRSSPSWRLDMPRDVTTTRGCPGASIDIAVIERDIIRVDAHQRRVLLYLGQRPSDEPLLGLRKPSATTKSIFPSTHPSSVSSTSPIQSETPDAGKVLSFSETGEENKTRSAGNETIYLADERRPSSFQPALVRCSRYSRKEFSPDTGRGKTIGQKRRLDGPVHENHAMNRIEKMHAKYHAHQAHGAIDSAAVMSSSSFVTWLNGHLCVIVMLYAHQ